MLNVEMCDVLCVMRDMVSYFSGHVSILSKHVPSLIRLFSRGLKYTGLNLHCAFCERVILSDLVMLS